MRQRIDFETGIFMTRMHLKNKTKRYYVKHCDNCTVERVWVDRESAEQYIQHQQKVAVKYGGKIVSFEIKDIGV